MAVVAGGAGILVVVHVGVFGIGRGLGMRMTIDTREYRIVIRVGMTGGTGIPDCRMSAGIYREILGIVVPGRRCPGDGRVAGLAGGREICRSMDRTRRSVVIRLVTRDATRRSVRIAGSVTGNTGCRQMRTSQWK